MFVALVSVAGEALYQEFMKQEEIVKVLQTTAERVQQAKGSEKEVCHCCYRNPFILSNNFFVVSLRSVRVHHYFI